MPAVTKERNNYLTETTAKKNNTVISQLARVNRKEWLVWKISRVLIEKYKSDTGHLGNHFNSDCRYLTT